jgi:hypothetical protein
MKKFIITGAALVALAVPAVASANVDVNDQGVGFVGKGDVQTALGGINDAAVQSKWSKGEIAFTSTTVEKYAYSITCANGTKGEYVMTTTSKRAVNVVARTTPSGKVTQGWDLTGLGSTIGQPTHTSGGPCTGGFTFDSFTPTHTVSGGGLQVNGIDLPNTPVEVAPVA